jgi:hypothetical protein
MTFSTAALAEAEERFVDTRVFQTLMDMFPILE